MITLRFSVFIQGHIISILSSILNFLLYSVKIQSRKYIHAMNNDKLLTLI